MISRSTTLQAGVHRWGVRCARLAVNGSPPTPKRQKHRGRTKPKFLPFALACVGIPCEDLESNTPRGILLSLQYSECMEKIKVMLHKSAMIKALHRTLSQQGFCDLDKSDIHQAVDLILEQIGEAIADGDRVEIRNFGSFNPRDLPGKPGRNPKTGESLLVPPGKACTSNPVVHCGCRSITGRTIRKRDGHETFRARQGPLLPALCARVPLAMEKAVPPNRCITARERAGAAMFTTAAAD